MFVICGQNTWIMKYHYGSVTQCEQCGYWEECSPNVLPSGSTNSAKNPISGLI
jgi:hypothetical protein